MADSLKATETRLGSYRVEVKEKHDKVEDADRTLFRTYYNNEDFAYEDYYVTPNAKGKDRTDNFTADYVRATIKDGRVLFIMHLISKISYQFKKLKITEYMHMMIQEMVL